MGRNRRSRGSKTVTLALALVALLGVTVQRAFILAGRWWLAMAG